MRDPQATCHGGVLPLPPIRVPDLEAASSALAAHKAKRPEMSNFASYDAWREAHSAWCNELSPLQVDFEMASQASRHRAVWGPPYMHPPKTDDPMPDQSHRKHTIEQLIATLRGHIEAMGLHPPRSPEWVKARNLAYTYRRNIEKRAEAEGLEVELPKIPTLGQEELPAEEPTPSQQPEAAGPGMAEHLGQARKSLGIALAMVPSLGREQALDDINLLDLSVRALVLQTHTQIVSAS